MIGAGALGAGARGFAAGIARRHLAAAAWQCPVARVPLVLARPFRERRQVRPSAGTLRLAIQPRLVVEQHTPPSAMHVRRIEERIARHETVVREVVERTRRVEQLPTERTRVAPRSTSASDRPSPPPAAPIVVPPLPRVLRRATAAVSQPDESSPKPTPRQESRPTPVAAPAIDVARLTDEVMRGIDRRLGAWRERRGRG